MKQFLHIILFFTLGAALLACKPAPRAPTPSAPATPTTAQATLGPVVLSATLLPTTHLNAASAQSYGLQRAPDAWLLLITARDSAGNAVDVAGLQLALRAGTLAEAPAPVPLRTLTTGGMTDYVATLAATPPTTLRIELEATRGGAATQLNLTRDILPP